MIPTVAAEPMLPCRVAEDNGNTGARRVCTPRHHVALSKDATDYGVCSKNAEEVSVTTAHEARVGGLRHECLADDAHAWARDRFEVRDCSLKRRTWAERSAFACVREADSSTMRSCCFTAGVRATPAEHGEHGARHADRSPRISTTVTLNVGARRSDRR